MAKKITATHEWSKIFILIKIASNLLTGLVLIILLFPVYKIILKSLGIIEGSNFKFAFLLLIILTTTLYTLFHYIFINKLYDILSTLFYMRVNLKTKINFRDAIYLTKLFEPEYLKEGKWVSMTQIKELPEDMRRKAILDTAKKIFENKIDLNQVGQTTSEVKITKK